MSCEKWKFLYSFFIVLTQWHKFLTPKLTSSYIFITPLPLNVTLISKSSYLTVHIKINYETGCIGRFSKNFLKCIRNTSHKFWDQSPFPHYQCCLQISETVSWHKLWCCYSANILQHWVGGRDLIYFCKVGHFRISRIFSRKWVGLNDLCEILSQNLRKLGK